MDGKRDSTCPPSLVTGLPPHLLPAQQERPRAVVAGFPREARDAGLQLERSARPALEEVLQHLRVLLRIDAAGRIDQPSARSHEPRGGVQQAQLLARMLREIALLQAPFHIHAMAHHARVGARHVQQDRGIFSRQTVIVEQPILAAEHVALHQRDIDALRPGKILFQTLDARTGQVHGEPSVPIFLVTPDGQAVVAADELAVPNGMALSPDGRTLVVAETLGRRLTAFDVAEDGTLSGRRVFADVGERKPDGICMDQSGAVWFGSPFTSEYVLVKEGGEVLETIATPDRWAVSCALGDDGATLWCATVAVTLDEYRMGGGRGAIEMCRLEGS